VEFIDLKTQYERIKAEVEARVAAVHAHGRYIMGPEINELEERLADYVGVKHCITVSSGTDALLIAMMALGIGRGDEVITTPFSFIATAETIALLGARPVFVDIDPQTYNIDASLIEAAITAQTKAIMPVSLYGQCADMDEINAVATKHHLPVIEDGAQSFGATYKGKRSCALSTIGCTSFFPSKPLGCYGDGGACFTNSDELASLMRQIRVHGQDRRYHHPLVGINGRMDTIQAAMMLPKLGIFGEELKARQAVAGVYSQALADKVKVPFVREYNTSVFAQYTIEVEDRSSVAEILGQAGIPSAVHYPVPLNKQPAIQQNLSLPLAEKCANRVLSLPMHPYLNDSEQRAVISVIKEAIDVGVQS
jgi:UDP-2-acetamido-2-deoxy-ribo-hexuluronate aminotransferase